MTFLTKFYILTQLKVVYWFIVEILFSCDVTDTHPRKNRPRLPIACLNSAAWNHSFFLKTPEKLMFPDVLFALRKQKWNDALNKSSFFSWSKLSNSLKKTNVIPQIIIVNSNIAIQIKLPIDLICLRSRNTIWHHDVCLHVKDSKIEIFPNSLLTL